MACIQEGATTSNYFTSFEVCLAHLFLLLSRLHKNIHIPDSDSSILLYQTLAVSELSHLYMYGSSHVHTTPWPKIATDMADNTWPHPFASSNEAVVPPMPVPAMSPSSSHYPQSEASKYSQEAVEDRVPPVPPVDQNRFKTTTAEEQYKTSSGEEERKDGPNNVVPFATDIERNVDESGSYMLDEASYRHKHGLHPDVVVKKTKDGKKVLIPQPKDSRDDPLNWSPMKKRAIMVVLVVNAFTAYYSAATGASASSAQAEEWDINTDKVNPATAG
jgi:hypothetical protein